MDRNMYKFLMKAGLVLLFAGFGVVLVIYEFFPKPRYPVEQTGFWMILAGCASITGGVILMALLFAGNFAKTKLRVRLREERAGTAPARTCSTCGLAIEPGAIRCKGCDAENYPKGCEPFYR